MSPVRAALCLAGGAALLPSAADAHHRSPREVVEALNTPALREQTGIESVAPDPRMPRLLVIRVKPAWFQKSAADRLRLAAAWRRLWREAAPGGVLSVVDSAGGEAVVNFDARGRPLLSLGAGP